MTVPQMMVVKSSPNVHLDWSLDGTSGPFVLKRSLNFTFSNPAYLGPGQTTKTFDDAVLNNGTGYAYEAFRRTLTDTLYFYHADHLGTPIAMTNTSGALVWRAEHTPFGGIYALTVGTTANNLRFPGQYYDSETGLAQNWFRDYKHSTGRYWEPDPMEISLARNVKLNISVNNPFLYTLDSVQKLMDPKGLQASQCCGAEATAAALKCMKDVYDTWLIASTIFPDPFHFGGPVSSFAYVLSGGSGGSCGQLAEEAAGFMNKGCKQTCCHAADESYWWLSWGGVFKFSWAQPLPHTKVAVVCNGKPVVSYDPYWKLFGQNLFGE
jgi:RHS repeat-associated protein